MIGKAIRRGWLSCLPIVLLAVVAALSSSPARAQSPTADPRPQLVYQNPQDGDVLQQPAFAIQLCFASPINVTDLDKGGDFAFSITEPDGIGLGNRDSFQVNGYGVTVYPGHPVGDTAGKWAFHYRVTSPDAKSALEGDINYTVFPNGSPVPQETPPPCVQSGGTAVPFPRDSESPTPAMGPVADKSDNSSDDILTYALLAIGILGAAASLLAGVVLRRRFGQTSPRPARGATPPVASSASDLGTTPPPVVESVTPAPRWSQPASPAPPPVAASEPPLQEPRRSQDSVIAPPVVERETPLPTPSAPPGSATPPADSDVGESAGHRADNSKYALLAIVAAAIVLIGLTFGRRGKRRGRDGNDH